MKIIFTGGGSGGHVIPNIAIIKDLKYYFRVDAFNEAGGYKKLVGMLSQACLLLSLKH